MILLNYCCKIRRGTFFCVVVSLPCFIDACTHAVGHPFAHKALYCSEILGGEKVNATARDRGFYLPVCSTFTVGRVRAIPYRTRKSNTITTRFLQGSAGSRPTPNAPLTALTALDIRACCSGTTTKNTYNLVAAIP